MKESTPYTFKIMALLRNCFVYQTEISIVGSAFTGNTEPLSTNKRRRLSQLRNSLKREVQKTQRMLRFMGTPKEDERRSLMSDYMK